MVIALLILLPIVALMMGIFALYGVYMGLKWNFQMKVEQRPPENPLPPNPVKAIVQRKNEKQVENILHEWINGPEKKEGED